MPNKDIPISIIVPVYRVEKYLNQCLDSILCQTFSDFELILVDDESPDNCGIICDDYAKKDARVKVIHKKNGGVSDSRNMGLDAANGRYIAFVDSDDYVDSDLFEFLYKLAVENDADFSCCSIMNCYRNRQWPQYAIEKTLVVDNKEAYRMLLEGKEITGSPCAKLFKRELFDNVRFVRNKIYEDAIFFSEIIVKTKKVAVSTKPKYYYIHREGSYTTSFKENEFDAIEAYEKNLTVVKKHFPELLEQGYFRYYWAHFIILDKMLMEHDYVHLAGYHNIVAFLKKNTFSILKNHCFTLSRRISALFLWVNVRLYRSLLLKNNRKNCSLYKTESEH